MREYPRDIINDAEAAWRVKDDEDNTLIGRMCRAILAERERCAEIARNAQGPEEAYEAIMMGDV